MVIDVRNIPPADEADDEPIEPDREFWSQTTILENIRKFARSRGAAPYPTLAAVLRRTTGCIQPYVLLPSTVGGLASLNLFTTPVGPSGAGKDIANAAGYDAIDFYWSLNGVLTPVDEAAYINPGSGEGLARIFRDGEASAHLQVPDVATIEALAGRRGQTLVSQLLAAWMGQPLGFANNDRKTTTAIKAHSYRLCLSVGVQPENAGFFLDRERHGFPQRFLWLPTLDPYAPEARPDPVGALSVELPTFETDDGRCVLEIPDQVADEIWRYRWLVNTGAEGVDPLDTHIKLTQLKTAAAIAVLHGETAVTDDAWKIAGQLIEVSTAVREGLRGVVAERARRENTARAHGQADREVIVETRLIDSRQQRVLAAIERKLERAGTAAEYELYMVCDSSIRDDFKPVFDRLVDDGFLVCCDEGGDGRAPRYRRG